MTRFRWLLIPLFCLLVSQCDWRIIPYTAEVCDNRTDDDDDGKADCEDSECSDACPFLKLDQKVLNTTRDTVEITGDALRVTEVDARSINAPGKVYKATLQNQRFTLRVDSLVTGKNLFLVTGRFATLTIADTMTINRN